MDETNVSNKVIQGDIRVKDMYATPRVPIAKVCIWSDLTVSHMDVLSDCRTMEQIKNFLPKVVEVDTMSSARGRILIDLFCYTIQFGRENSFSKEQMSAFFSIVKRTHELAVETPFENVHETFTYFKELLLCHSVFRPPFSLGLFSPDQVQKICTYMVETYFRHYKLYKYAFTPQVRLDLSINYNGMPDTPPPEPADGEDDEAVTDENQEANGEDEEGSTNGKKSATPVPDESASEPEESEAAKQLREMVRSHLAAELKKLKISLDDELKVTEEGIAQRITSAEVAAGIGGGKKGSGKKKK